MELAKLEEGKTGIILKVKGRGAFRKRLMEMGFVVGKAITVIKKAPFHGPVELSVMGTRIILRHEQAELIEVTDKEDLIPGLDASGTFDNEPYVRLAEKKGLISVALLGNPTSGKTSLFNHMTGLHEKVGNYGGVTVESKNVTFISEGTSYSVTDLPGTYSTTAFMISDSNVRDFILNEHPDILVNVIDAANLERSLYLTTELIDMDQKVVIALNVFGDSHDLLSHLDTDHLSLIMGIPIVAVDAGKGTGISELYRTVKQVHDDNHPHLRHIHIYYGQEIEEGIKKVQAAIRIPENQHITDFISSRFLAIKLLEKDVIARERIAICKNTEKIIEVAASESDRIKRTFAVNAENIITEARYGFINGALKETLKANVNDRFRKSEVIDSFFTHKFFGLPIFLFFMWLMFYTTFTVGSYPMSWIENGVDLLSSTVASAMNEGMLKDLLVDGIISGTGGVLVFLPNILILFFFISLMEDTGYMSRAVFIMDKAMHRIGLHGKSFIPLVMGFGCNVPAIMSTRILENRTDRIITILINPFISCNARLPVYILFITAFFPDYPGLMLFIIYLTGILVAVSTAILLRKTIFRQKELPFVMELPPYRAPSANSILRHMWEKGGQYLKKIGGVILIASVIFWTLSYFPRDVEYARDYDKWTREVTNSFNNRIAAIGTAFPDSIATLKTEHELVLQNIRLTKGAEHAEKSYIGRIGKTIEPLIAPLGFDWKIGVSIISGIPAKEIIVSTMGVLFQANDEHGADLVTKIREQRHTSPGMEGQPLFTPLIAFTFMIFVLLYFPCIGTISSISREAGSWKWGLFSVIYTFTLAWLVSFLVYRIGLFIL
ncbi:MAG: ferrous iron transport protein B [Bacteroidetes bacterium]|nr:ferrous iron transport protein B [Bacteroidota bacterium]